MHKALTAAAAIALLAPACTPARRTAPAESNFRELLSRNSSKPTPPIERQLHAGRAAYGRSPESGRIRRRHLHPFAAPDHPKAGGLVAFYSRAETQSSMQYCLLQHRVVESAKREDWTAIHSARRRNGVFTPAASSR